MVRTRAQNAALQNASAHVLCRDHGASAQDLDSKRLRHWAALRALCGDAYQSGIDGQLLVWIDQQKYMADISL